MVPVLYTPSSYIFIVFEAIKAVIVLKPDKQTRKRRLLLKRCSCGLMMDHRDHQQSHKHNIAHCRARRRVDSGFSTASQRSHSLQRPTSINLPREPAAVRTPRGRMRHSDNLSPPENIQRQSNSEMSGEKNRTSENRQNMNLIILTPEHFCASHFSSF